MEFKKRHVGAALVVTLLMASAFVAWSVAALAQGDDALEPAPGATAAAEAPADHAAHDPEAAEPFDGPKHKTYDASLDPAPNATEHDVTLKVTDEILEVADGRFINLWTFGGTVPGPVLRVTEGDTIHFKIVNDGLMAHSIDFHAAQIAPNRAYVDVAPGESFEFDWVAEQPGVFMYHCGTAPVMHHIGNGMYGMIIVDPAEGPGAPAREYALVQSEFYFGGQGEVSDLAKMKEKDPDWIVFNGYAQQYVHEPLKAKPGERVRLYLLNAGVNEWSAFHVIGAIFDRTWQEGVEGGPAQTISLAPSQGAIVEFTMDEEGTYPFVTHAFADADKGAVGTFKVGDGGPKTSGGH